jgi:hypothetical protein
VNSLNKHVPTLVFLIGLGFLIYSIRTFFNPSENPYMTPIVNRQLPANAPARSPVTKIDEKRRPTITFSSPKKPPAPITASDVREEFLKELKKPAIEYLARVGLAMAVPEGFAFAEETDGPVQVLVGASEPGKMDFYFFSAKGRYPPERAASYLRQYFAGEMKITPRGSPQPFITRGTFKNVSQLKGGSERGDFQAFFFTNSKTDYSHLMLIFNRAINKSPARVRELIDSLRRKRG